MIQMCGQRKGGEQVTQHGSTGATQGGGGGNYGWMGLTVKTIGRVSIGEERTFVVGRQQRMLTEEGRRRVVVVVSMTTRMIKLLEWAAKRILESGFEFLRPTRSMQVIRQ